MQLFSLCYIDRFKLGCEETNLKKVGLTGSVPGIVAFGRHPRKARVRWINAPQKGLDRARSLLGASSIRSKQAIQSRSQGVVYIAKWGKQKKTCSDGYLSFETATAGAAAIAAVGIGRGICARPSYVFFEKGGESRFNGETCVDDVVDAVSVLAGLVFVVTDAFKGAQGSQGGIVGICRLAV